MPTPEQHAEVAIAILNHIAYADGVSAQDRGRLGLTPNHTAKPSSCGGCLICVMYGAPSDCPKSDHPTCPCQTLCRKYCKVLAYGRERWVRAYRYHAGRAP